MKRRNSQSFMGGRPHFRESSSPPPIRSGLGQTNLSQFQFQPQVHSFPPQHPHQEPQVSSSSSSGDSSVIGRQSEKTSLLSTKYSNYNDPLS